MNEPEKKKIKIENKEISDLFSPTNNVFVNLTKNEYTVFYEIFRHVFSYLSLKVLVKIRLASKRFLNVVQKTVCHDPFRFPLVETVEPITPPMDMVNFTTIHLLSTKQRLKFLELMNKMIMQKVDLQCFRSLKKIRIIALQSDFEFNWLNSWKFHQERPRKLVIDVTKLSKLGYIYPCVHNCNFTNLSLFMNNSRKSKKLTYISPHFLDCLFSDRSFLNLKSLTLKGFCFPQKFNFEVFSKVKVPKLKFVENNDKNNYNFGLLENSALLKILEKIKSNEYVKNLILKNIPRSVEKRHSNDWVDVLGELVKETTTINELNLKGIGTLGVSFLDDLEVNKSIEKLQLQNMVIGTTYLNKFLNIAKKNKLKSLSLENIRVPSRKKVGFESRLHRVFFGAIMLMEMKKTKIENVLISVKKWKKFPKDFSLHFRDYCSEVRENVVVFNKESNDVLSLKLKNKCSWL